MNYPVTKRRILAVPVLLISVVSLGAVPAQATVPSATAASSDSCAPIQSKAKQAAKQGKSAKAKRLRAKYRACQHSVQVRSQLAGYTFTGTRGDGEPMTVTLCDNGKWISRTGAPAGVSQGDSWYVRYLTRRDAQHWTTQVGEYRKRESGGWSIGLARSGPDFQIGIASFDTVSSLGPVVRTSAAEACAALG